MSVQVLSITENFAVAGQLTAADMQAVADAGFKSVIINRPDHEGGADQPLSSDVIAAAKQLGLVVHYQPVVSGAITPIDVQNFGQLLTDLPAPVLAYCRSGGRCTQLYHAATAA